MKLQLLKQTALVVLLSCSLSLVTGCASSETAVVEEEVVQQQPECLDETGATCVMVTQSETALYLPEFSSDTYKTSSREAFQTTNNTQNGTPLGKTGEKTPVDVEKSMGGKNGTDLAFSKPASEKAVSVKDKKRMIKTEEVEEIITPQKTEIKEEAETVVTETVSERVSGTISEPAVSPVDHSKAGIKKVKTETKKHTLADKVAYGEKCRDWEATAGETLRSLLIQWGEESGWTVVWKLDRDYNLEAGVVFRGTFTEVSGALIRSFARATPAPIGTFYKGNRVLVVNTQEDENAD